MAALSVPGALPSGAGASLAETAAGIVHEKAAGSLASAVASGALVALSSHMLAAMEASGSRITVSYAVGFLLALGPFDHVVVTVGHLLFGVRFGGIAWGALLQTLGTATVGNLVGGLDLVTLSHVAQAKGAADETS